MSRVVRKNMLFENANNCTAAKNAQIDRDFVVPCPDKFISFILARKVPYTTIAEFANTVDPDETAHNEPSHLDLQCFCPLVFDFFNITQFILKGFQNFVVCFFWRFTG